MNTPPIITLPHQIIAEIMHIERELKSWKQGREFDKDDYGSMPDKPNLLTFLKHGGRLSSFIGDDCLHLPLGTLDGYFLGTANAIRSLFGGELLTHYEILLLSDYSPTITTGTIS